MGENPLNRKGILHKLLTINYRFDILKEVINIKVKNPIVMMTIGYVGSSTVLRLIFMGEEIVYSHMKV